jgi:hypothetical protein
MFLPFRLRDLYILVFLFNKALNVKQNWLSEQLGKSYNLVNSYV